MYTVSRERVNDFPAVKLNGVFAAAANPAPMTFVGFCCAIEKEAISKRSNALIVSNFFIVFPFVCVCECECVVLSKSRMYVLLIVNKIEVRIYFKVNSVLIFCKEKRDSDLSLRL